ncbi:HNH endonuclease [bacterium RCC_150]
MVGLQETNRAARKTARLIGLRPCQRSPAGATISLTAHHPIRELSAQHFLGGTMLDLKRIYWCRRLLHFAWLCTVAWIFAAAIVAVMNTAVSARPTSVTDILQPKFNAVLAADVGPALLAVALVVIAVLIRSRDVRRRDPLRRFTRQQRREGLERAAGRCEMEGIFHRRCSRQAEHGDHFYPWSKGGATSLQNFVAACAPCNRVKSAKIPTPGQQRRLEQRRLEYFGAGERVHVGERRPI